MIRAITHTGMLAVSLLCTTPTITPAHADTTSELEAFDTFANTLTMQRQLDRIEHQLRMQRQHYEHMERMRQIDRDRDNDTVDDR